MEAFLLAPKTPAQNPIQAPDLKETKQTKKGGFAPLLNETMKSQEGQEIQKEHVVAGKTDQGEETNRPHPELLTDPLEDAATSSPDGTNVADNWFSFRERNAETALFITGESFPQPTGMVKAEFAPEPAGVIQAESFPQLAGVIQEESSPQLAGVVKAKFSPEQAGVVKAEQVTVFHQNSSQSPVFTIATIQENGRSKGETLFPLQEQGSGETITPPKQAETLLLQQIQQLLNEGKNKGPIIIQTTPQATTVGQTQAEELQKLTSPALIRTSNGEIQAQQTLVSLDIEEGKGVEANKSAKLEGNRQDITGQYLSAKMGDTAGNGTKTGDQSQQSGSEQQPAGEQNKSGPQPATGVASFSLSPTSSGLEAMPGSQFSLNPAAPGHTSIEGKFAPGAQLTVPEPEIVNHLIQRFSVNPRLQTSKLTMQLHPAELGELKVDILVKEGSIKANIVAQSQQVLDTLEKNMPRLRTILEQQGFTVDSFKITMDGEGGRQQEFFQEHFSSQQQEYSFTRSSAKGTKSFDLILEKTDVPGSPTTDSASINVTA
ncbi:MAG: flagellar hook-length control protein FliK [Proteobacteria bacterium]|nr:flagellar hook-length control protein FliK [Pseudomonadota bacterium]MBU1059940.1 flagellar hook-length control protein FliK [Pseudomonadota bacterium]